MPTRVAEQAVRGFADALIWNWLIKESKLPARLADLVAERSGRCARLLGA
jgi:hypothetical protein